MLLNERLCKLTQIYSRSIEIQYVVVFIHASDGHAPTVDEEVFQDLESDAIKTTLKSLQTHLFFG